MSWGDVWVNGDKVRPKIDAAGPRAPWIPAGVISPEERSFVEATQLLRRTRGAHARTVEFNLQVTSSAVGKERSGTGNAVVGFKPDGLWLAVDVTPAGSLVEEARFVVFTQRVHVVDGARRVAERGTPVRGRVTIPLRGRARTRESALEWGHSAARD
ncbi:MAG: hypothetical protein WB767_01175 [Nocardioides sp.]